MKSLAIRAAVVALVLVLAANASQARPGGGGARGASRFASPRSGGASTPNGFRGGAPSGFQNGGLQSNGLQNDSQPVRTVLPQADNRPAEDAGRETFDRNNFDRTIINSSELNNRNQLPNPNGAKTLDRPNAANRVDNAHRKNAEHVPAFTPGWYAEHPQAWQFTQPHADAWAVTSFATAAAWLNWNAVQPAAGYSESEDYNPESDTVVPPASDATLPTAGAGPPAGASNDWLPLGVYALVRPGQTQGTTLLQLAIDKEGAVIGTYFDEISDASHILQGSVNSQTQLVDWTVGDAGKVTFQAGLDDLTQSSAPVALQFASGRTTYATLVRQTADNQK